MGRRLFDRLPRGVAPTAVADDLAAATMPHVDTLDGAVRAALAGAHDIAGTLFLGGPADFLAAQVIGALAPATAQAVRVRVRFGLPAEVGDALVRGDLDLAVVGAPVRQRGIEIEPLYIEQLVLVVPPPGRAGWYARPRRAPTNIADTLAAMPLVAYGDDLPLLRRYWRSAFGRRLRRDPAVTVPDLRSVVAACTAGMGITVLPRYLCERELATSELIELHTSTTPPTNQLSLAWRSGAVHHPRVAYVRDLLLAAPPGW